MAENVENKTAKRLRALRAESGKTQKEVADELNIRQQTYSNYEKGITNIDSAMIITLCNYYGVTADYLLGIDDHNRKTASAKAKTISLGEKEGSELIAKITKAVIMNLQTEED